MASPHLNPEVVNVPLPYLVPYNGHRILCPHLHLYVKGFEDKWAIPAPKGLTKRLRSNKIKVAMMTNEIRGVGEKTILGDDFIKPRSEEEEGLVCQFVTIS